MSSPKIAALCDCTGRFDGRQIEINGETIPVVEFSELLHQCVQNPEHNAVLLTDSAFLWNRTLEFLRPTKVEEVYVAPDYLLWNNEQDFWSGCAKVPMDRPMLTYYEYYVTDQCNLNCYQCGAFSNLVTEPEWGDFEQYKKDLARLKELFWNVGELRFQGGEPLLNPNLPEFIRVTREAFPYASIGILSNGLLIPNADPALFEAMRKYRVFFWCSGYPPTHKIKDKIKARCAAECVPVSIMPEITEWREESIKVLEMPPSNDWEEAEKWWRKCGARDSHLLKDGYLYYCCFCMPLMKNLYKRFDLDLKNNHMWQHRDELRFDLSDPTLDGWTISEKLDHVHEVCLYCVNRWPNFGKTYWRPCPAAQAKLEDYMWDPLSRRQLPLTCEES